MKPISLCAVGLLIFAGCSLGEAQATRRMGRWERYPEFRACIKQAAADNPNYGQKYESCLKLEVVDEEAMRCVQDITPVGDLSQVKMCQRQLGDLLAYGSPSERAQTEPSGAWAGPGIGSLLFLIF
jgi:hypothetical protein